MGEDTTMIVHADVYTHEIPSTSNRVERGDMSSHEHGGKRKPKKDTGSKKQHIRNWMHSRKKKKKEANLFAVMMSSGDSSFTEKPSEASVSLTGFDTLDDARPRKDAATTSKKSVSLNEKDAEAIEMMPIVETTLPTTESKPNIEKNGLDVDTKDSAPEPEDSACDICILDCIYITQRCCECTIL